MKEMLNWTGLMTTMMQTRYSYEVPIRRLHGTGTTPPQICLYVDWVCCSTHGRQHWIEVNGQWCNLINFFQETKPLYQLRRKLCGLQSWSERCR